MQEPTELSLGGSANYDSTRAFASCCFDELLRRMMMMMMMTRVWVELALRGQMSMPATGTVRHQDDGRSH